jgi:hypothetical protein
MNAVLRIPAPAKPVEFFESWSKARGEASRGETARKFIAQNDPKLFAALRIDRSSGAFNVGRSSRHPFPSGRRWGVSN